MRILTIDIDTLRPDHLGCCGYERDTSPILVDIVPGESSELVAYVHLSAGD